MRLPSIVLAVVVALTASTARADLPDGGWAVVRDRPVIVTLANGAEARGRLVAIDAGFVTLLDDAGRVVPIDRTTIAAVRLAAEAPAPPPSGPERHVGLQLYSGPGNLMVDVDLGRFYGYAGGSIGYPIIFSGTSEQYGGGVVGAGVQWRLSPTTRWKFDLTGTLLPTWWAGFSMGIGVTAGFHWTSPSGLTVGFKIPVFGVAPGNSIVGDSGNGHSVNSGSLLVANYYLEAAMALPIVSLGYRFR